MEELFQHQRNILNDDPEWCGLFLGTGGGKTRLALELARGRTLVVAPKQQTLDETWIRNRDRFHIILDLTVISKETFRRDWASLPRYDTVIIDEAHHVLGATTDTKQVNKVVVPKFSQMFEAVRDYVEKNKPSRFYLATATPASKPMNVWAIATLLGKKWDFYAFREKYYIQRKSGWRSIWIPRGTKELKQRLIDLVKSFGYTGKLSDWFDVPEQVHITKYVALTSVQKQVLKEIEEGEADPMVKRTKKRTVENGCIYEHEIEMITNRTERMTRVAHFYDNYKNEMIEDYSEEFPRMLIFANYIAQIDSIAAALKKKGKKVFTVTGQTKDRQNVFLNADEMEEVVVICQSGISEGYEFKKPLDCVIFASKSYRFLYYEQALGRPLRADALNKNLFIHLVVKGGMDEECHKAILQGKDFQEKIYE